MALIDIVLSLKFALPVMPGYHDSSEQALREI